MAIRIVGNNHRGTYHTWNDVDNENPTATLYFEESIMFTPHVLTYPLYGNITAYYYKYADDVGVHDSYPVLYADNNGQPGEKLTENEPLMKTAWRRSTDVEGWIQAVVPMRRSVAVGEKVWFAFFGFLIAPRYDLNPVQTLWLAWWQDGLSIYSKPTERVGRVELESWRPKMRLSMYFTYSDVVPSVDYVRSVTDIARGSDDTRRVQTFVRKCTALGGVVDFLKRQHEVLQKITSRVTGFGELSFSHGIGAFVQSLIGVGDRLIHWIFISLVVSTLCRVWERFFRRKSVHRVEIVLYSPITLELNLGKK